MPAPPSRSPAECLAAIVLGLSSLVDGHSTWGRLARRLAVLIIARLRSINQRFARIAARVAAGRYAPHRGSAQRRPTSRKPRAPDPLPRRFAWLRQLLPEAAGYDGQLQTLLADPEMVALLQAAPTPLHRPLRSLCRMLGVTPPPILAHRKGPAPATNPSPAQREREGPAAQRPEGEGEAADPPLIHERPPPLLEIPQAHGPPLSA